MDNLPRKTPPVARTAQQAKDLPAGTYALVALAGLLIGTGLLLFYVNEAPRLAQGGAQSQVYYILLIPWALSCAAFLFGTMRSYARFKHRHLGNALELGGPVVLFCIVLAGGFKLVPQAAGSFELTVRPRGSTDTDQTLPSGSITLYMNSVSRTERIGPDGQAHFRDIPASVRGVRVKIMPQVAGYRQSERVCQPVADVCELVLERSTTHLKGVILDPPQRRAGLLVRVTSGTGSAQDNVDDLGSFDVAVPGAIGDTVQVQVYSGKTLVYDRGQTLGGYGSLLEIELNPGAR
jgi:hypothetical protein